MNEGHKNVDSGGWSLCLPIPDQCLAKLHTFSNVEQDKFETQSVDLL